MTPTLLMPSLNASCTYSNAITRDVSMVSRSQRCAPYRTRNVTTTKRHVEEESAAITNKSPKLAGLTLPTFHAATHSSHEISVSTPPSNASSHHTQLGQDANPLSAIDAASQHSDLHYSSFLSHFESRDNTAMLTHALPSLPSCFTSNGANTNKIAPASSSVTTGIVQSHVTGLVKSSVVEKTDKWIHGKNVYFTPVQDVLQDVVPLLPSSGSTSTATPGSPNNRLIYPDREEDASTPTPYSVSAAALQRRLQQVSMEPLSDLQEPSSWQPWTQHDLFSEWHSKPKTLLPSQNCPINVSPTATRFLKLQYSDSFASFPTSVLGWQSHFELIGIDVERIRESLPDSQRHCLYISFYDLRHAIQEYERLFDMIQQLPMQTLIQTGLIQVHHVSSSPSLFNAKLFPLAVLIHFDSQWPFVLQQARFSLQSAMNEMGAMALCQWLDEPPCLVAEYYDCRLTLTLLEQLRDARQWQQCPLRVEAIFDKEYLLSLLPSTSCHVSSNVPTHSRRFSDELMSVHPSSWLSVSPILSGSRTAPSSPLPSVGHAHNTSQAIPFMESSFTSRQQAIQAAAQAVQIPRMPLHSPPNEIDLDRIRLGLDHRTTVMVRNIPNKYSQQMMIDLVNESHYGRYTFLYLRMDFKNRCNVGYAFLDFVSPLDICSFAERVSGKKWSRFNSDKVCTLSYANIQGKSALIEKFRNSSVMEQEPAYRPKIFHTSGALCGQEDVFPLADHQQQQQPSHHQHDPWRVMYSSLQQHQQRRHPSA